MTEPIPPLPADSVDKPWLRVLRDAAIIFGMTFVGGFAAGLVTGALYRSSPPLLVIGLVNLGAGIAGFAIVTCLTPRNRLRHLARVGFVVWIMSLLNLLLGPTNMVAWLFSSLVIAVMLLVGLAIGTAIKPANKEG